VVLGEVGGTYEYEVIEAYKNKHITKPILAWCMGTVSEHFPGEVQFGHAGAFAVTNRATADAKNRAMREAGFVVPKSFNALPKSINDVYISLRNKGIILQEKIVEAPSVPEDFNRAVKFKHVRKATHFICTISDDRGEESTYAGVPISQVSTPETGYSIGDVISLLWCKKRYPKWASNFIETVIKTVADHGPAVSGAHNAKVTARAGKDVISSLVTGLLTIGPRFGGAIDGAASHFKRAFTAGLSPQEFVQEMKGKGTPIPGIGHRVKSLRNPDLRVKSLIDYAKETFPDTSLLEFALKVEKMTSAKKDSLILNVDGCVGVLMVDMWQSLGYMASDIDELIDSGTLNAFFVLGRTIGFIGHILDEKRLNMPLYRHPFEDILYDVSKEQTIIKEPCQSATLHSTTKVAV
ncbi:MAG: ATP citrate synthase, partial [Candidatus Margulisbacteria bacterium]|nr:ATP citrate synthase [Candidatus Margulisiibacteriota bacterium]